jgi:hypothetical protein
MIKRMTWFLGGVATGVVGAGAAKRKLRAAASELAPAHVARRAGSSVRRRVSDVGEAVREGRRAMRAKEAELRARLDGRVRSLADELPDADAIEGIIVDGRQVEPGQVIVLRQVRDAATRDQRASKRPRRRA